MIDEKTRQDLDRAFKAFQDFFFDHATIYSKNLMIQLEKETSVEWYMWSLNPIKPTEFNPNHKIKYWIRRLFKLQFKTVVQSHDCDGLGYYFINPFTKEYRLLKENKENFLKLTQEEYPKDGITKNL